MGKSKNPYAKKSRMYDIEGVGSFPSVTEVLSLKDKSGPLMGWAVKMAIECAKNSLLEVVKEGKTLDAVSIDLILTDAKASYRKKSQEAMDTGSKVHNAIEVYTRHADKKTGLKLVQALTEYPQIEKPFNAFLEWEKERKFELVKSEHKIWSLTHKYAGTLDCIAKLNGVMTLVDFKSSTGIREDYVQQIAAYRVAHEEIGGEKIENTGCLRLDKITGLPEWVEYSLKDNDEAFEKFLCLLKLWWLEYK